MKTRFYRKRKLKKIKEILHESIHGTALGFAEGVNGYSGKKLITLLKLASERILQAGESCYVEIGVFRGLTLLSVGDHLKQNGNTASVFGIDNFSQFDVDGQNKKTVEDGLDRLGLDNVSLINLDYEVALQNLSDHIGDQKIGVFFIDGPHDYRSQLMCLQMALPFLADECIILVDDCNYQHVRLSTHDFLVCHPEFKLAFEGYTPCHPKNASAEQEQEFRETWWDGVHCIVRDPENTLPVQLPEIGTARELCLNEHEFQASQFAHNPSEIRQAVGMIENFRLPLALIDPRRISRMRELSNKFRGLNESSPELKRSMNTYSKQLKPEIINKGLI